MLFVNVHLLFKLESEAHSAEQLTYGRAKGGVGVQERAVFRMGRGKELGGEKIIPSPIYHSISLYRHTFVVLGLNKTLALVHVPKGKQNEVAFAPNQQ